jgi:geranylgeranyl pyrophosphate synthase
VQGKKTLPMYVAYQHADAKDKKTLNTLVGKKDITFTEIAEVKQILERSQALVHSQNIMDQYKNQALTLLEAVDVSPELRTFLRGFIAYASSRQA